jgi:UDP-N-acetylglucosamine acyltransferase
MNKIHSTAIIGDNVELGVNNEIGAYTVIEGPTKIGNNNIIGNHVVIGSPGQDTRNPRYDSTGRMIEIGDNNIIREFTAIQKPCYRDITRLGNNIFLMQSVHIPHDAILHDDVVITPMCVLAGISTVLRGANIAMGTTIHQYSVIGHYSLAAMGSAVTKNIKPFTIFVPGKNPRVNQYAVDKFGFKDYTDEIRKYVLEDINPTSDALMQITEEFAKLHVESKRPLYQ